MRAQSSPTFLLLALLSLSSARGVRATSQAELEAASRPAATVASEPPAYDTSKSPNTRSTRPIVGTADAPVDGLDGKPHAGPFVDSSDSSRRTSEAQRVPSPKGGDGLSPEDGVMNDPRRLPPKEGTTGTEGGVSEKSRNRMILEEVTGEKIAKTPDPPKEVLPHDREQSVSSSKPPSAQASGSSSGRSRETDDDKPRGFVGLEKPTNLPEKPHNIPHPVPAGRLRDADDQAPGHHPSSRRTKEEDDDDDDDDSDDDDEDEEGVHDIVPWDSLFGSFSSIAATEIGDKTFIVAALMAMRHSRLQVFSAAFSALFIMTILSGLAGHAVGAIISKRWSALVAALLFLVFGAKSLREGFEMSPNQGVSDEIREVEAELEEKEVDMARMANGRRASAISPYALEAGRGQPRRSRSRSQLGSSRRSPSPSTSRSPSPARTSVKSTIAGIKNLLSLILSPAWVETFSMTFVGELGDRSQIATVAMAAGQEFFWVMVGASLGHFVCTGVAVIGGSVLAGRVSLRKVTLVGGGIFIAFGIFTLIEAAQYWA